MASIVGLKPAVIQTMANLEGVPVEFRNQEWQLMDKILKVLQPFVDATNMLSAHDASISMVIPFVTSIICSLENEDPREEHGVLTLKRDLKTAMETRFGDIENIDDYIVATLLDSKYKGNFYRGTGTFERAKNILMEKLVEKLREEDTPFPVKLYFMFNLACLVPTKLNKFTAV